MRFNWPIKGIGKNSISIAQLFGDHKLDYSQFGLKGHNGIDIAAPLGTPIYATADGYIVEQTSKETGFGLRISQRVDDEAKHYLVVYGHMQRLENPIDISYNWNLKNYPVKAGDLIGFVDSTGFSTGNHLHFGVYEYLESGLATNSNNGYGGAINQLPLMATGIPTMSNALLVKKGAEYGIYLPATTGDGLITLLRNIGIQPVLKPDGTVDFDQLTVQGDVVPR